MFRFHTGSIKRNQVWFQRIMKSEFRFHTGSIKRTAVLGEQSGETQVSIPYWFD